MVPNQTITIAYKAEPTGDEEPVEQSVDLKLIDVITRVGRLSESESDPVLYPVTLELSFNKSGSGIVVNEAVLVFVV